MSPIHSAILGVALLASGIAATGAPVDPAGDVDRRIDGAFVVAASATAASTAALAAGLRPGRGDRVRKAAGDAGTVTVEHRRGPGVSTLARVRLAGATPADGL